MQRPMHSLKLRWQLVRHSQDFVMFTLYAMLPPVTSIICMPQGNHYTSSRLVTMRSWSCRRQDVFCYMTVATSLNLC